MKVVRREVEVRVVEKVVVVVVVERDERGRLVVVVVVVNLVAVEVWVERDGIVRDSFVFCTWERGGRGFMTDDCGG